jgi:hypothetical protein
VPDSTGTVEETAENIIENRHTQINRKIRILAGLKLIKSDSKPV